MEGPPDEETGETATELFQNYATKDDFTPDEKGGIITLNFSIVDGLENKQKADILGDLAVEEVVHAAQYENKVQLDNSKETSLGRTANTEFEAKAIVGQIQLESRRDLYTSRADKIANRFGVSAFKTGSTKGYFEVLKKWHTNPKLNRAYRVLRRTDDAPGLLIKLIKTK